MGSPSESEGEIIESLEVEKANKAKTFGADDMVNRHYSSTTSTTNTPRQSVEPGFGLDGAHDDSRTQHHSRSHRPQSHRSQSHRSRSPTRTRSPFQHPRGEKRRHDDDYDGYYDGDYKDRDHRGRRDKRYRRHPDDRHNRHRNNGYQEERRAPVSYADIDSNNTSTGHYNDGRGRSDRRDEHSRERIPSRGPFRHPRAGEYSREKHERDEKYDKGMSKKHSDTREYNDFSREHKNVRIRVGEKRANEHESSKPPKTDNRDANPKAHQDLAHGGKSEQNSRNGREYAGGRKPRRSSGIFGDDKHEWMGPDFVKRKPKQEQEEFVFQEPVDEEAETKKRRLKRAALKARLALNPDMDAGASAPATPQVETPAAQAPASPALVSPATPQQTSVPGSPMHLSKAANADAIPNDEDEPSAADYDPTMDKLEDQARQEQRKRDAEAPVANLDDVKDSIIHDVPIPETEKETTEPIHEKDDMFASDDDEDDMFSDKPVKVSAPKPLPMSQVKTLAHNLRDNDDNEGYYKTTIGEVLDGRYVVKERLGNGMYARVVRCWDTTTKDLVAIKIMRSQDAMRKAGMKEIEILLKLCNADPKDEKHIVRFYRHFSHKGHLCMVFESLNNDLRKIIKIYGRKKGLPLRIIRSYAVQMFKALCLLRKEKIIHADIKPDNILAVEPEKNNKIKIADLGSATDASDAIVGTYQVSRFYRAPEITLGIKPDFAIDMWAIGCTLFELYTEDILFKGESNNQMLKCIMQCRGKFSKKLLRKGDKMVTMTLFDEYLEYFRSVTMDKITGKQTTSLVAFSSAPVVGHDIKSRVLKSARTKGKVEGKELDEIKAFVELLEKCLQTDPEQRITPHDALAKLSFFQNFK